MPGILSNYGKKIVKLAIKVHRDCDLLKVATTCDLRDPFYPLWPLPARANAW